MMLSEFIDDLRQTNVIMNQEFHKYLKGKKLVGFIVLMIVIIAGIYLIFTCPR